MAARRLVVALTAALGASAAPGAPSPDAAAAGARVRWHAAAAGLDTATVRLRTPGEKGVAALGRVRVVLARVEPARFRWALVRGPDLGAWRLADAPPAAALALNAGQFTDDGPWGWVVHRGREVQAPGTGALAAALVVTADGRADVVDAAALDTARAAAARGAVAEAVQSYPALLEGDGALPAALAAPGGGVDLAHRDARLAVGVDAGGRLVVALTRYDAPRLLPGAAGAAVARALDRAPLGLTVPEAAALMRALGCRRAVLLDGGLSAQLRAGPSAWPGLRAVPLGIVAVAR